MVNVLRLGLGGALIGKSLYDLLYNYGLVGYVMGALVQAHAGEGIQLYLLFVILLAPFVVVPSFFGLERVTPLGWFETRFALAAVLACTMLDVNAASANGAIPPPSQFSFGGAKTFLVTGGNSGVGFASALIMAERGANVIIGCRSTKKCKFAAAELRAKLTPQQLSVVDISTVDVDIGSYDSIVGCVQDLTKRKVFVDFLMLNAGFAMKEKSGMDGLWVDEFTADGIERWTGSMVVGHQMLFEELKDAHIISKAETIVSVTASQQHTVCFWRNGGGDRACWYNDRVIADGKSVTDFEGAKKALTEWTHFARDEPIGLLDAIDRRYDQSKMGNVFQAWKLWDQGWNAHAAALGPARTVIGDRDPFFAVLISLWPDPKSAAGLMVRPYFRVHGAAERLPALVQPLGTAVHPFSESHYPFIIGSRVASQKSLYTELRDSMMKISGLIHEGLRAAKQGGK